MRETFVIGDAHSNHKAVMRLLQQEGLVEHKTRVRPEVQVLSIGDLANCVRTSRDEDLKILSLVGPVIDKLILGNHEAPYLGLPTFAGFFMFPEIKDKLRTLMFQNLLIPCRAVGDILVSHAGVAKNLGETFGSAQSASQAVYDAFMYNPRHPLLANIGRTRGGDDKEGGVLWSDWTEPKSMNFKQIVGHSIGITPRWYLMGKSKPISEPLLEADEKFNPTYNIDIGCNSTGFFPQDTLAGAWISNGDIRVVTYDA